MENGKRWKTGRFSFPKGGPSQTNEFDWGFKLV